MEINRSPSYASCLNLAYTLKRLGYVHRAVMDEWARDLFILTTDGPLALKEFRKHMYGDHRRERL